jgi:lysosomal Pro-X carboxypeptidase
VQISSRIVTINCWIFFHCLFFFVFASNGAIDPWSGGGVLESLSKSLVAVVIPKGAHHLDLRTPDLCDPDYISQARQLEKNYISQWLDEYYSRKSFIW